MRLTHKDASPTYVYLQSHETSISFSEIIKGDPDVFNGVSLYFQNYEIIGIYSLSTNWFSGVSHADDIIYLHPVRENFFSNSLPTKEDEEMRESFVKLWVDFARTGWVNVVLESTLLNLNWKN